MDRAINMVTMYYEEIMDWYDALPFLEQMGVLFGLFIAAFGFVAFLLIRK